MEGSWTKNNHARWETIRICQHSDVCNSYKFNKCVSTNSMVMRCRVPGVVVGFIYYGGESSKTGINPERILKNAIPGSYVR